MAKNDDTPAKTSEIFDVTSDSDICIRSGDGIDFHLHRKYLESSTGVFPGDEFEIDEQPVTLTESADVLEILFQFIYPRRHPNLLKITSFDMISEVAEAAEKYEVFSAMNACQMRMKDFVSRQPLKILVYALKHDYPDLTNETSEILARMPLPIIFKLLPPAYMVSWVAYYNEWSKMFTTAVNLICNTSTANDGDCNCSGRHRVCLNCRFWLLGWIAKMEHIEDSVELRNQVDASVPTSSESSPLCHSCTDECILLYKVRRTLRDGIRNMDPFTVVLKENHTA